MFITIHASGMPFNGETIPNGGSLGGSESAAYYMAKELAKLGHRVTVFTAHQQKGRWDDVLYEWHGEMSQQLPLGQIFHTVMKAPYDVVIVQRHPLAFALPCNSKLNMWWLHDLAMYRHAGMVQGHLANIDRALAVSEFHRSQVGEIYAIGKDHIVATTNGVDYNQFEGLEKMVREPRALAFAARPERGLDNLVGQGGIMEELEDCHLYVCGYDNTVPQMRGYYEYLWRRCDELPNVTNMGALGKRQLYELLARCELYVYPTTFEDTSCIMVLEANAAGTPFIGCQHAAVPETAKGGGALLLPLKSRLEAAPTVDKKAFVKQIRKVLHYPEMWQKLHKKALEKQQSWGQAAIQWDGLFKELLKEKSGNKIRLHKHLERRGDIIAVGKDCDDDIEKIQETLPDFKKNYGFLIKGDFKGHYDRYYEYERDRGVIYGPEDLTGNRRFEQTADIIGRIKPKTILDYGCAHGHYVMNLAKRFADISITGIDICQSNIDIACKWAQDEKQLHRRVHFFRGDHNAIRNINSAGYDVIVAAEILEHVLDPGELINRLMEHLTPAGTMIVTVPYGPWEALGFEAHPGWRAHIHHFERQDLIDMFGNQKNYRLMALPLLHTDDLGHWIVTFQPSGNPVGKIDYTCKLNRQAPRETLSVCMIAKDVEYTIGKTLQTVKSIADEIIVGIDEKTGDRTQDICRDFGARCFSLPSPMEIGFDEARNLTIEKARMDWILWIDADETLENPQNLPKFLRPNCFDGYGIHQQHHAAEPAAVIKTDFPVRIFRNRKGIRFFGFVHEHPEEELNKGVEKILVLPDVAIIHTGYSTELIRRKRFERNFPLMQKDRKKYPDRNLGKFLWLRDLAHMIRYALDQNGGVITEQIAGWGEDALNMWRELVKLKNVRMTAEGLAFYSEVVGVLKNGNGIYFQIDMNSKFGGSHSQMARSPLQGLFANNDDIRMLTNLLMEESIKYYEKKYF